MQTPFSPGAARAPQSVFANFSRSPEEDLPDALPNSPRSSENADAPPLQTRIDSAMARSFLYRAVARSFEYPDQEGWACLRDVEFRRALFQSAETIADAPLLESIRAYLSAIDAVAFDDLLTAHLCSFGHAARGPNPTNEIEYGELKADPLIQPHRLADLAAFYRAFGLEVAEDAAERVDHISVELEFMSVLAAKDAYALEHQAEEESIAAILHAQKQFLREHLGRWVPAFARRLARAAGGGPISALADFTCCFVTADCDRFNVKPGSEELVLRELDESESICASCGVHQLPPGALDVGSSIT